MSRLIFIAVLFLNFAANAIPDFALVRNLLTEAVTSGKVAGGSVLVLHRGEVVFAEGFGFVDLESKEPFQVQTPVVIASISKPLLGTAAFRLSQQGKLNLTAPVSEYLPEFIGLRLESGLPVSRAPTMIELFSHTSGMRSFYAPGGTPWFASWTFEKPLAEVVKRYALEFRFEAQPGARYAYSGIGTDVAARVLEVAASRPRNELFVAELAKPLGMARTFYRDAASLKLVGPMPTQYFRGKDGALQKSRVGFIPAMNMYSSSGGAIISIAPDLSRWLLMIRNNGQHEGRLFLEPQVLAEMLAGVPHGSIARGGLFIRKKDESGKALLVGHTGSSGTNCWIDFERDIIGIMLTQTRGKDIKPFRLELEKCINKCLVDTEREI
ncbi:MAG: serine hydrolase [Kiritimatiellae bacterium]|nr:serine hydrolase [Kiritimatiellia bacterium]